MLFVISSHLFYFTAASKSVNIQICNADIILWQATATGSVIHSLTP